MNITSKTKILLTGATGTMGRHLASVFQKVADCYCLGHTGDMACDSFFRVKKKKKKETENLLIDIHPDIIVHTAALTDVDLCERSREKAYLVNVETTRNLVDWIRSSPDSARLVYISTDQVYGGPGEHDESRPFPRNVYGMTKLWAEDLARRTAVRSTAG